MERKIYDPGKPTKRRTEWVDLPDGRSLCVHGLTAAEFSQLQARSALMAGDPRGDVDKQAAALIQVVMSCYSGDEADAARIFGDLDLDKVGQMSFEEYNLVAQAIQRVNGLASSEQEILRDFMTAQPAQSVS